MFMYCTLCAHVICVIVILSSLACGLNIVVSYWPENMGPLNLIPTRYFVNSHLTFVFGRLFATLQSLA